MILQIWSFLIVVEDVSHAMSIVAMIFVISWGRDVEVVIKEVGVLRIEDGFLGRGPFCSSVCSILSISNDRIGLFCRWQFLAMNVRLEGWQSIWFLLIALWVTSVLVPISVIVGKWSLFLMKLSTFIIW